MYLELYGSLISVSVSFARVSLAYTINKIYFPILSVHAYVRTGILNDAKLFLKLSYIY